ncbi:MAG: response regulator [Rhodospirillaceae bacterium]|nr:response regulator [Rhodospirillaceae bacterium]
MSKPDFKDIRLVIADGGGQIRDELRGILRHEGFRDIVLADSLAKIEDAVISGKIDLLITDHDMPDGNSGELIRQIRHREIGHNPFIVIISLAQEPDKDEIMSIINSGADDLVLKPITTGMIIKRVHFLANQRKDFVVTSDYIGPTRRSGKRDGSMEIEEFKVPNPVQRKAFGKTTGAAFQKEIDEFTSIINEQKVERNAFQISYLVTRIMPFYSGGKATADMSDQLNQLRYVSEDFGRRLKGSKYDHVGELCDTMLGVVNNVCENPQEPNKKDLLLLPNLAQAIDTAFAADASETTIARNIADSVKKRTS